MAGPAPDQAATVVPAAGTPKAVSAEASTLLAADQTATEPGDGRTGPSAAAGVADGEGGAAAWHFRTQAGQVLGTPLFMSPEQARGEPLTPASVLFAFGLLLQQLFTGVAPHPPGLGLRQIIARAANGETLPPGRAARPLLNLIRRLKATSPLARPTAVDTLEQLRAIRELPRRRAVRAVGLAVLVGLAGA
ncbi:MAG TPA: hypothetical protein PKE47_03080, partial [Verrucomicrobiota bacterium]|nr:hypothetical protein [Verrucomicrobiota bacterium]